MSCCACSCIFQVSKPVLYSADVGMYWRSWPVLPPVIVLASVGTVCGLSAFTLYCSATPLVSHLFSSLLWYLLSYSDTLKLHVLGYFFWKHILGNWKTQTWTLWHLFIIKSYSIVKSWLGEYKSLNIHRHPVRFRTLYLQCNETFSATI